MAENNTVTGLIAGGGAFVTSLLVLLRIKSVTNTKMENIEKDIKDQKERIDDLVQINDFNEHNVLIETKFDHIKESLDRIEAK